MVFVLNKAVVIVGTSNSEWYVIVGNEIVVVSAAIVAVDEGGAAHVVRAAGARIGRGALRVRAHEGARRKGPRRGK